MAGQQQIPTTDRERYYNQAETTMLKQADLMYFQDKYRIGDGMDELKSMHAHLYQEALCTDNCDLLKWIQKKIAGKLETEDIKLVDLKELQTKRPDIYITNIYNTNDSWNLAEW